MSWIQVSSLALGCKTMREECNHERVRIIESIPEVGEVYGTVYGRCEICGWAVKCYGHMEDDPRSLEPAGPWQLDPDADPE